MLDRRFFTQNDWLITQWLFVSHDTIVGITISCMKFQEM